MLIGLSNALATMQRLVNKVFHNVLDVFVLIYLDNLLIYSKNEKDHKEHIREVLERLKQYNLKVKAEKCKFHKKEVKFLGYTIRPGEILISKDKVKAIQE